MKNKPLRSGTLEQVGPADENGEFTIKCLNHPQKQLPQPTLERFKQWECCPRCADEAADLPSNVIRMVGKRYRDYVALSDMGPEYKKQRGNGSRHPWWRCYCIFCHKITIIRADILRNGAPPLCACKKKRPVNEVDQKREGEINGG